VSFYRFETFSGGCANCGDSLCEFFLETMIDCDDMCANDRIGGIHFDADSVEYTHKSSPEAVVVHFGGYVGLGHDFYAVW
jgi:hypothetical protein